MGVLAGVNVKMVREAGVEPTTFGSGGSTTPQPSRTKLNLASNFPVVNPDIRHLLWFVFWFEGEVIPKGIRRVTLKDSWAVAAERLLLRSGGGS